VVEDGVNRYTWGYSTPTERYFLYGRGRDAKQVEEVLGEEFEGVLVTDYYAAYNCYDGDHQRCWAHLLRDIEKQVKLYEEHTELRQVQIKIKDLFQEGKRVQNSSMTLIERHTRRRGLETELLTVVTPYLDRAKKQHPFHTLAKRIDKYVDEHFTFVLGTEIPATNNAAERAVRHGVIARKISGGTRSKAGTRTKEILASLFGTWHVRGLNPLEECQKLLTNPHYSFMPAS
jgi:transposase